MHILLENRLDIQYSYSCSECLDGTLKYALMNVMVQEVFNEFWRSNCFLFRSVFFSIGFLFIFMFMELSLDFVVHIKFGIVLKYETHKIPKNIKKKPTANKFIIFDICIAQIVCLIDRIHF